MRTALFNFFIKHRTDGQFIILENIRHLPDIGFEKTGANITTDVLLKICEALDCKLEDITETIKD